MKYRPEIDGLRALSILPVVFFHAGFNLFNGGYIGVDIFFVISGYLITSILLSDLKKGEFRLSNFYFRRARRILPALILVMIVSIPFAWLWMVPFQMKDFSQSVVSTSLFGSNFLFWLESGYFDLSSEEKPLLHTWSLAVEEQYYLFFPVFLFLIWKLKEDKVFKIILIFTVLSFLFCEWSSKNEYNYNFYLAPSRAWEIFVGSIAAFLILKKKIVGNNFLSITGISLILFSIFFFNKKTPFPSAYTLIPVLGVFLIIIFTDKDTFIGKLLSSKFLVNIGLISYSFYLWHYPVFAFAKIKIAGSLSNFIVIVLIFLSLFLSIISWKFIEKPFRNSKIISDKLFLKIILTLIFVLLLFGILGHKTNGYKELMIKHKFLKNQSYKLILKSANIKMNDRMFEGECHIWVKNVNELNYEEFEKCYSSNGKALLIFGDSHAMNLYNIISKSNKFNFVIAVADGGCRIHNLLKKCKFDEFKNFIINNKLKFNKIIYHQSGSYYIQSDNGKVDDQSAFEGNFKKFHKENINSSFKNLNSFSRIINQNILWVGPFLEYRYNPLDYYNSPKSLKINPESLRLFKDLNPILLSFSKNYKNINFKVFSEFFYEPHTSFESDCFVFSDVDHYSKCGENIISKKSKFKF